jgi:uncharacterized protein YeeX (DUF496 family)
MTGFPVVDVKMINFDFKIKREVEEAEELIKTPKAMVRMIDLVKQLIDMVEKKDKALSDIKSFVWFIETGVERHSLNNHELLQYELDEIKQTLKAASELKLTEDWEG